MEIAGPPVSPPPVPAAIRSLAGDDRIRAVWLNELGGLTFELTAPGSSRRFAKWAPAGSGLDLEAERVRLEWAGAYTTVPRVLSFGSDGDGEWMLTAGLPGDSAVSASFQSSPERQLLAVQGIARGLRMLHDALPVDDCPFSWSVSDRVASARAPDAQRMPSELDALLGAAPSIDRLVACHGDACAPNTLLDADGAVTGHVDLGSLGVADRWADIAVSAWSTEWNYGPGYEPAFLEAYGIAPDPERLRYYRALWDAT
ncbi:aminoglycoside 3'-phosphotransferase [Herbiconiux sp. P17]|uniref:aminoglycoside 3'-phosphotransferase n=1 Tax=Herbiconiux wuyangfengii TaxID=3342794 RepID=UPI0035B9C37C